MPSSHVVGHEPTLMRVEAVAVLSAGVSSSPSAATETLLTTVVPAGAVALTSNENETDAPCSSAAATHNTLLGVPGTYEQPSGGGF